MADPKKPRRIQWAISLLILAVTLALFILAFFIPALQAVAMAMGLSPMLAPALMFFIGVILELIWNAAFELINWRITQSQRKDSITEKKTPSSAISSRNDQEDRLATENLLVSTAVLSAPPNSPASFSRKNQFDLKALYRQKAKLPEIIEGYDEITDTYFYQVKGKKFGAANRGHAFYLINSDQEDRLAAGILIGFEKLDSDTQQEVVQRGSADLTLKFQDKTAGSCVVFLIHAGKTLYITNLGDSIALLVVRKPDGTVRSCKLLNTIHNTRYITESELTRIQKIQDNFKRGHRVGGALEVTRSLGDKDLVCHGVSHESEIVSFNLETLLIEEGDTIFSIVASDAFTDRMPHTLDSEIPVDQQFKRDVENYYTDILNENKSVKVSELPKVLTSAVTPPPDGEFSEIQMVGEDDNLNIEQFKSHVIYIRKLSPVLDAPYIFSVSWLDAKKTRKLYLIKNDDYPQIDQSCCREIKNIFKKGIFYSVKTIDKSHAKFNEILLLCTGNGGYTNYVDDRSIAIHPININQSKVVFTAALDGHQNDEVSNQAALEIGDILQNAIDAKLAPSSAKSLRLGQG